MTHPYRCTHDGCRKRVTLRRRRHDYTRPPRCPDCGAELAGREDRAMRKRDKRRTCSCDGYHFPHRRGSPWCSHYAGARDDRYYEARYGAVAA